MVSMMWFQQACFSDAFFPKLCVHTEGFLLQEVAGLRSVYAPWRLAFSQQHILAQPSRHFVRGGSLSLWHSEF